MRSNYPLRILGQSGTEGDVFFTEEDLESHVHILGATGEGKSKLLELLIRQNIDNGYGCCLLDPSDNGDTCYKVLKYAIRKGYEKIILIDPHDIRLTDDCRVPCFNPIHLKSSREAVSGDMMDALEVLWGTEDFSKTAIISDYVPAIIEALHAAKLTLREIRYFGRIHRFFNNRRQEILSHLDEGDESRVTLEEVYANPGLYKGEFRSTIRRLKPFRNSILSTILGANGLDFYKLITQGYIILVNLDREGVWGTPQQRLLGTLIINEITYAISRLRNSGWKGVYYLYIDEAGDYATSKLSYILDKKRKSGLRLTLSHQRFDQFSDKGVSSAVYGGTKIKVLFNTPGREDRDRMIKMMFGGQLSDREVSYHLQDTPKQNCWIKNNKAQVVKARIIDLPDINIKKKILDDYKLKIYSSEFYKSVGQIREETKTRFANLQPTGGRPVKATGSPATRPEPQRPDDGDSDVKAPAKRGGLPTKPQPKSVPPTFIHKRKQDANPVVPPGFSPEEDAGKDDTGADKKAKGHRIVEGHPPEKE